MEKDYAIYPRILIDKELVNIDKVSYRDFKKPVFKDDDSQICLNTLMFFQENMVECTNERLTYNLIDRLRKAENDDKIKKKVKWLCDYTNEYYMQNYGMLLLEC